MSDHNGNDRTKQASPFFCIPNHVIDNLLLRLQPTSFATLAVLFRYRNERGLAYPSYDKIHALTGYSRTTISKALTELQAEGAILGHKKGRGVAYSFPCVTSTENGLYVQYSKWTGTDNGPVQNMDQTSTENGLVPVQKMDPIKTNDKDIPKKTNRENALRSLTENDFEKFWSEYGRKGSKADARRAWSTHTAGVTLDTILTGVAVYLRTKRVTEGYKLDAVRFITRKVWENPTLGEEGTGNNGKTTGGFFNGYKVPDRQSRSTGKYANIEAEETF